MKQLIYLYSFLLVWGWGLTACSAQESLNENEPVREVIEANPPLIMGAEVLIGQLENLAGLNLGLLINQTSMISDIHIVDALIANDVLVDRIFAPEHGFRGQADAGEKVSDGLDSKTKLPIISLYGSHKKPTPEDLDGLDVVIFDIQDVGARFYTYISTLHYLMEACAENKVKVIVLDRPNPNGDVVDGQVLDMNYSSFVGKHPIPVLHGMTVGEYAQMINGEKWLKGGITCDLQVINCINYTHKDSYSLPVKPSPNLPDDRAIKCYPSTCFFEGTVISEGRGTGLPFQVFGSPNIEPSLTTYSYMPISKAGAKYPKFENERCFGFNISNVPNDFEEQKGVNLNYIISIYNLYPNKGEFFLSNGFFDKLAGGSELRKDIIAGKSAEEIKASWQEGIDAFKLTRSKYLLYPDFE
ncbi:MAG: hypothetical protein ACI9O4_002048 [Chitinophagales bacterium]|jgi:uncharacterized protein YbbC (DUF1343 family)